MNACNSNNDDHTFLPEDLLVYELLPSLPIRELLRLRAVHPSFTHAIATLFGRLNPQPNPPILHLPWFYCMVARPQSTFRRRQYDTVAVDPSWNTWYWLPHPAHRSLNRDLHPNCIEPICSLGSLVCWEYILDTQSTNVHFLILSNAFTGDKMTLPLSTRRYVMHGFGGELRLEQSNETGRISIIRVSPREPGHMDIDRYTPTDPMHQQLVLQGRCVQNVLETSIPLHTYIPHVCFYHQGTLATFYHMHHHILPELSLYEGSHWCQVRMPDDFTSSQKSMLDARWLRVFDDYTLIVSIPYWRNTEFIDLHAVARANILVLSIGDQIILCNLVSNTWRSLPPCYNATTGARVTIVKVACALDPTY
ncbi:hypothetical protein GOP47_0011072 [Adiantum capillus-veneris]|uniref:Uncharacterized protein n=1 Tax=Adiantum capillus-veneris TaxID=13818 RepID=A0A9D4ZF26_ADICA|nr:hypothetical protein GOP47_0011072 [Adiantum capillus-veneris]